METIATIVLTALRLFFLLPSSAIVLASLISPLRNRFFLYGPRAVGGGVQKPGDKREKPRDALTSLNTLLDHLASYQVPHGYFFHFYVFSTTCSIFWLSQLATGGSAFRFMAQSLDDVQPFSSARNQPSMSSSQVYFCLMLMLLQGSRRLYECLTLTKGSRSQMWIAHWLFGLSFYAAINIAVWIEGIRASSFPMILCIIRRVMRYGEAGGISIGSKIGRYRCIVGSLLLNHRLDVKWLTPTHSLHNYSDGDAKGDC